MNVPLLILAGVGVYWLVNRESFGYSLPTVPDELRYGELMPSGYTPQQSYQYDNVAPEQAWVDEYGNINASDIDPWSGQPYPSTQYNSVPPEWQSMDDSQGGIMNTSASNDQVARNVAAALAVLKTGESENNDNAYRRLFYNAGAKYWNGEMTDHPGFIGWKGEVLPRQTCINAGFKSGICFSNAAGAYQFISTTWRNVARAAGLPDFSPASQDAAAIYLMKDQGALPYVQSGNMDMALMLMGRDWASMPGSTSGQGKMSMAQAKQIYTAAGGMLANSTLA